MSADLLLPFSGVTPISRHCSYQGAVSAQERVGRQALAMLAAYRAHGALTDAEMAITVGIERSSVNARRSLLVKLGLVEAGGVKRNDITGISNTLWQLAAIR